MLIICLHLDSYRGNLDPLAYALTVRPLVLPIYGTYNIEIIMKLKKPPTLKYMA